MDRYFEYSDKLNHPLEVFEHISTEYSFPILPHWHYFVEIILVKQGRLLVTSDDSVYAVHPGDILYFPPQSLHSINELGPEDFELHGLIQNRSAKDCLLMQSSLNPEQDLEHHAIYPIARIPKPQQTISYFVIKFDPGFVQTRSPISKTFPLLAKHAYSSNPESILFSELAEICTPYFQQCIHEMYQHQFGYDSMVCSYIAMILTAISRNWINRGFSLDQAMRAYHNAGNNFEHITQYIEAHYNETLQVKDLAQHCGMSYSYFAKLFRETYGQSCKDYMEFVRINKVTNFLQFTNLDLNYISQETGFADCSHLIRTFKKYKGCTPKQWKRKAGNEHGILD